MKKTILILSAITLFSINNFAQEKTGIFDINERLSKMYKHTIDSAGLIPATIKEMSDWRKSTYRSLKKEHLTKDSLILASIIYYTGAIYSDSEQYKKAIQLAREGIKFNSFNSFNYYLYGLSLQCLSKMEKGKKAARLNQKALEKYRKALEVFPETERNFAKHSNINIGTMKIYLYMGKLYMRMAYQTDDRVLKENYFDGVNCCFKKVYETQPPSFYLDWTIALGCLAEYKPTEIADSLYHQALQLLYKIRRRTDNYAKMQKEFKYNEYYLWGGALQMLGNRRQGTEADSLYSESIAKLEKAIQLIPDSNVNNLRDCYEAIEYAYARKACLTVAEEPEKLFETAIEYGEKSLALGVRPYTHACVYALKGDAEKAFYFLLLSLKRKETTFLSVENDKDWQNLRERPEYQKLKKKYK